MDDVKAQNSGHTVIRNEYTDGDRNELCVFDTSDKVNMFSLFAENTQLFNSLTPRLCVYYENSSHSFAWWTGSFGKK